MPGSLRIRFEQAKLWLLTAILFSLPVSFRVSAILILTLVAVTIVELVSRRESVFALAHRPSWIPASFYLLALIGLMYTTNMKVGLAIAETQASLLMFPFIFSYYKVDDQILDHLKKAFVIALVSYVVLLELWIVYRMIESGDYRLFAYWYTYDNASTNFFVQPVYFGMFILLAVVFCIGIALRGRAIGVRLFYSTCGMLLCFFLFQLAVRGPLITGGVILSLYMFRVCYERRKWMIGFVLVAILLGSFFFLYSVSNFLKLRMQDFITELSTPDVKSFDPLARRLIWPAGFQVFTDHWMFGVGTGDGETLLREEYHHRHLDELYERNLNAHNEYITQLMRYGLLALIPLFLTLIYGAWLFVKARNVEAVLFILMVAAFFVTESVLNRAQGVMFVSLFLCLFLASINKGSENSALRN